MAAKRPTTPDEYIRAAPPAGHAHLRQIHALLQSVAPTAEAVIKWGNPFFVEPRFLFAYSAHKAHLSFAPGSEALARFSTELAEHDTTRHFLRIPYTKPLPEDLIRRMAEHCVSAVAARTGDGFW